MRRTSNLKPTRYSLESPRNADKDQFSNPQRPTLLDSKLKSPNAENNRFPAIKGAKSVDEDSSDPWSTKAGSKYSAFKNRASNLLSDFRSHKDQPSPENSSSDVAPSKAGGKLRRNNSLPSMSEMKQEKDVTSGGLSNAWKKVASAQMTVVKMNQGNQLNRDKPVRRKSSSDVRKEYGAGVRGKVKTHIPITRGRVFPLSEVMTLKAYFDDIDIDKNGTVDAEELCIHRRNNLLSKDEQMELVLSKMNDNMVFGDLLGQCFTHLSKKDIEMICEDIKEPEEEKDNNPYYQVQEGKVSVWSELEAVFESWPLYCDTDNRLKFNPFQQFLETQNEEGTEDENRELYNKIKDNATHRIHKEAFSLWWVNYYKPEDEELTWEDIADEFYAFEAKEKRSSKHGITISQQASFRKK